MVTRWENISEQHDETITWLQPLGKGITRAGESARSRFAKRKGRGGSGRSEFCSFPRPLPSTHNSGVDVPDRDSEPRCPGTVKYGSCLYCFLQRKIQKTNQECNLLKYFSVSNTSMYQEQNIRGITWHDEMRRITKIKGVIIKEFGCLEECKLAPSQEHFS